MVKFIPKGYHCKSIKPEICTKGNIKGKIEFSRSVSWKVSLHKDHSTGGSNIGGKSFLRVIHQREAYRRKSETAAGNHTVVLIPFGVVEVNVGNKVCSIPDSFIRRVLFNGSLQAYTKNLGLRVFSFP